MIKTQKAGSLHAREMAELLNEIIAEGTTSTLATPVTASDLVSRMAQSPCRSAWHVAEDKFGQVIGFQWIEPAPYLPSEAAEIATFTRIGHVGLGIGSRLFEATKKAARNMGYSWINANIRADNMGGLAYYQSRGFETYGHKSGVRMENGLRVDKVLKRFDL